MCIRDRVGSVPALLLGANTQFGAEQFVSAFDAIGTDVVVWSDELSVETVSYTHLRAHETVLDIVCRLLLEKKQK